MNMKNGWEESHVSGPLGARCFVVLSLVLSTAETKSLMRVQAAFIWATYGSTAGAILLFLGIVLFARWKRLLFIPDATSYNSGMLK